MKKFRLKQKLTRVLIELLHKLKFKSVLKFIMTRRLDLINESSSRYTFKLAETIDEFEQAFAILHDCYVEEGYMQANEAKLRITAYHLLPTTTTLICKDGDKVIATISIIKRGEFGIPADAILNINDHISIGESIGEVSSLAIKKEYRSRSGNILFPFVKFSWEYSMRYLDLHHYLICHHPKFIAYYQTLFCFERITPDTIGTYDFANGAPVDVQILNLKEANNKFCVRFYDYPKRNNIWNYLFKHQEKNFIFPIRNINVTFDNFVSPEIMDHFFIKRSNILNSLNNRQLEIIKRLYSAARYRSLITSNTIEPSSTTSSFKQLRRGPRLPVNFKAEIHTSGNDIQIAEVIKASIHGLQIKTKAKLAINDKVNLKIKTNEFQIVELTARVRNINDTILYGLVISGEATDWYKSIAPFVNVYGDTPLKHAV